MTDIFYKYSIFFVFILSLTGCESILNEEKTFWSTGAIFVFSFINFIVGLVLVFMEGDKIKIIGFGFIIHAFFLILANIFFYLLI